VPRFRPALAFALLGFGIAWAVYHWSAPREIESPPLPATVVPAEPVAVTEVPGICADAYRAICSGPKGPHGESRDPTGAVKPDLDGERQAAQLVSEVIHEHPDWDGPKVDEELVQRIYTPKRVQRLQDAFLWAQTALESFISLQPNSIFNVLEKKKLIKRLKSTQLQLPPPAAAYEDEPDLYTKTDVFYERTVDGHLRMRMGGAYVLAAKSWFNIIFTVAHELAHSIDPCEIRSSGLALPAYDRLSACFLRDGLIVTRKTRSECGQNDQLSETFADWMAVQVTAQALQRFSTHYRGPALAAAAANSVRDLCEQEDEVEADSQFHPSPRVRIDRIFSQNPRIRAVLGCAAPAQVHSPLNPSYCGFGEYHAH
jgi:hypothetical protein